MHYPAQYVPVVVQRNGMATASLTLGIIAAVFSLVPVIGIIAWPLSILGLIFGCIAVTKTIGRRSAIAGLVLNGLALVICSAWLIALQSDLNTFVG